MGTIRYRAPPWHREGTVARQTLEVQAFTACLQLVVSCLQMLESCKGKTGTESENLFRISSSKIEPFKDEVKVHNPIVLGLVQIRMETLPER